MLQLCDERKALILDEDTLGFVSLNYSRSNLLEKNVYFFDTIDRRGSEKLKHLAAIFFVRNTPENFTKIKDELANPLFSKYYLVFSNPIEDQKLREFADCDKFNLVLKVIELFADFYAINRDLFSLNIKTSMDLLIHESNMSPSSQAKQNRILQGVFACVLSCRKHPYVRYAKHSNRAAKLADSIVSYMSTEDELFARHSKDDEKCTLLILDRKDDPITPLLNQWTYQSMIHELIGINNHRVKLDSGEEIVINPDQDEFFGKNMYKNYGEMAEELNRLVNEFKEKNKSQAKVESIEDMQRFMETYPEFKKYSGNVTKHVNIMSELSRKVERRKLLTVSEIEQDIAIKASKSEHTANVTEVLEDPEIDTFEKIRLVTIYALRYEGDTNVAKFKNILKRDEVKQEYIDFIDIVLQYAGKKRRSPFLFGKGNDLLTNALNIFKSNFKDVKNVFTQHKSCMHNMIEQMVKGKLSEVEFPYSTQSPTNSKTTDIIIFIIGGATYQEAKEVAEFIARSPDFNVILGGTIIHNSKSFIGEATEVKEYGL
jgi:vacuolar protein sorting-associated protein 45